MRHLVDQKGSKLGPKAIKHLSTDWVHGVSNLAWLLIGTCPRPRPGVGPDWIRNETIYCF